MTQLKEPKKAKAKSKSRKKVVNTLFPLTVETPGILEVIEVLLKYSIAAVGKYNEPTTTLKLVKAGLKKDNQVDPVRH